MNVPSNPSEYDRQPDQIPKTANLQGNIVSLKGQKLQELLLQEDATGRFSGMVEGVVRALQGDSNPERFYQAAHSIRELSNLLNRKITNIYGGFMVYRSASHLSD